MRHRKPLRLLWRILFICLGVTNYAFAQFSSKHAIGTLTGKYHFSYNQTPDQLVEIYPPGYPNTGFTYLWEQSSTPTAGFTPIAGAIQSNYSFSAPLTQTTYLRRKSTQSSTGNFVYSNVVKIQVVSVTWEDLSYIREHDVQTTGITDWQTVDQLVIGQKLQTTTYFDGLGRPIEQISRETATSAEGGSLWGDVVQFSKYDALGREPVRYLPYTTTTQSGKFKTAPLTEQPQYYTAVYNETSAFSSISFDNSPLNRVVNVKEPGASWAASAGSSGAYETNSAADNVQIFSVDYVQGNAPLRHGAYPANTLFKTISTDENGKRVIEYTNKSGQIILKKVQIDDNPSEAHSGWICTYSIYDDFGRLRYQLQPEAVKYLDANGWSFVGTSGQQVLNELCFQYDYDAKGRTTWKKAPGATALKMIYDARDRVVFTQDGNQAAKSPAEWTATLYDALDRPTITTLYRTSKSVADLQNDLNNSMALSTVNGSVAVADMVVNSRLPGISRYAAQNSIEFVSDGTATFESSTSDEFVAEIDLSATSLYAVTQSTLNDPISAADLNNASVCTIVKYQYYDNYSFAGAKSFDAAVDNTTAYSTSDPNVIPIAPTQRTLNLVTGSKVRVLGTSTFLLATCYYDEKGNLIQVLEDNIKAGQDVTTFQYHFDGRLLSSHSKHSTLNTGYTNFGTLTKNVFDKIGRVSSVEKKYGSNGFKTIASYEYDDVGRLKNKRLAPGYTGTGKNELESLAYSYNIHNNITGINKDYALKTPGRYDKWGNFFGLYLGYDNRDGVFSAAQLDGHVSGLLWNTQGDDAQRKYDYMYDNAGRLINALFKERQTTGEAWSNVKMDFSVSGYGGKIGYDFNGNLLSMTHKGVLPGGTAPVVIDDLHYTYASFSNKLIKVTDNSTIGSSNGKFGDFKDGSNGSIDDYVYDANGNLVIDLNKNAKDLAGVAGANGIRYNYLDKPEEIRLAGKGTITIVYDANGNKLQRTYTPEGGATITTSYINEFVYQGEVLQYINFEEGRVRVMQPLSQSNGYDALTLDGNMLLPNGKEGVYDYFIRDYQENVRMILTEEVHTGSNQCTMETARAASEEPLFGQSGSGNEVVQTRFAVANIPGQGSGGGWQNTSIGSQVSRLGNLSGKKTGPNALLKVMAGDQVSATTQYYYQNPVVNGTGSALASDVLNSLVQALSGSSVTSSVTKEAATAISGQLGSSVPFNSLAAPDATNSSGTNPKAYLTVLFFDERFNFVSEGSAFVRVSEAGSSNASLTLPNIKAPKNGYCFVYLSNESDEMVYFDNLQVSHHRGRIVEENHFYSYGLRIAAISSKKLGDATNEGHLDNKHLYNDKELFEDGDLAWYDYGFRNYDPQIGRFTQLDPLTDDYPFLTPYQYAGGEPIANIDIDGLEPGYILGAAVTAQSSLSEVVVTATVKTAKSVAPAAAQAGRTALNLTSMAVKGADIATDFIPFVSGGKDIYNGIKSGSGWQVALGIGSIALDVFTAGSSSLIKGAAKTMIKQGAKMTVKTGAKSVARQEFHAGLKNAAMKFGCFVAGTLIWTSDGAKAIEQVKTGDEVYAYDSSAQKVVRRPVTDAYVREVDQLIKIEYEGEVIYTTEEHPFYINNQWVKAGQLKVGDSLFVGASSRLPIQRITVIDSTVTVFNFTVDQEHNYFVGRARVLVHNNDCGQKVVKAARQALTKEEKQILRNEATDLWETVTKRRAIWDGLEVHHRIPLEWSHLFGASPNRLSNLVGVPADIHRKFITPAWNAWKNSLKGRVPSQSEIMKKALEIDDQFSQYMKFVK